MKKWREIPRTTWLLALCWLVYAGSLLGKVNYAANITQIEDTYHVTHADAGMASTFYFFAYGVGQVVNGLLCKKYPLKYVVFGGLMVSALMNFLVAFLGNFALIKYAWLVNGLALSVLWPCLIRLLSECMPKKDMLRASVVMGTTTAAGTIVIYSLSALFVKIADYTWAFYTAAIVAPIIAFVWLFLFDRLAVKAEEETDVPPSVATSAPAEKPTLKSSGIFSCLCLLACVAVATNLIKDGLTTWVPSILKDSFALDASFSILLTLTLPIVGLFGNLFANTLYKRLRDFVIVLVFLFFGASIFLGVVLGALTLGSFLLALIGFALVYFLASSSNSTITSIFPLQMKGKINSGMIAGVLNGFCYVGSTISSYGLGLIADAWGWSVMFFVLLGIAIAVFAATILFFACSKRRKNAAE